MSFRILSGKVAIGSSRAMWGASINPVADSSLSLGFPDFIFGASPILNIGNAVQSAALIQFDMTPFQNQTVTGNATLTLHCGPNFGQACINDGVLNVFRTLSPWLEATATFNNFGATPGFTPNEDYDPTVLSVFVGSVADGQFFTFLNIPGSVLQGWIDNPSSNQGFLLTGDNNSNINVPVASRENAQMFAPLLTFNTQASTAPAPEPGTLGLLLPGLLLLRLLRSRAAEG